MSFLRLTLSTWFGSGYFPVASGTAGTLATIPLLLLLWWLQVSWPVHLGVALLVTILGLWAASSAEKDFTLAFCRRHSALIGRLFLHVVWVNLIKLRVENDPDSGTRAMAVGLTTEPWDWKRLLARRLQPFQVNLPSTWHAVYFRHARYPEKYERKPHAAVRAV